MRTLFLALAFLTGCSTVVPAGLARLATLSPLEADPAYLAVSLELPEGLDVVERSAQITLSATRNDTDTSSVGQYILSKSTSDSGGQIYAIARHDLQRFRTQQALLRGWKETAPDATKGSFGVTLAGCTRAGGPEDNATLSISVRTAKDGQFFPLVRNAPIADVLELGEFDALMPCPNNNAP